MGMFFSRAIFVSALHTPKGVCTWMMSSGMARMRLRNALSQDGNPKSTVFKKGTWNPL